MLKFIPNFFTIGRIVLTFVFVLLFFNESFPEALFVFSLAAVSDFLDGYYARKLQVVSKIGAVLDPVADKLLIFAAYMMLAYMKIIPICAAVIVILRDFFIVSVVLICMVKKVQIKFSPLLSSKVNTVIQLLFVVLVLSLKTFSVDASLHVLILVVCCSTVYSWVDYISKYSWIGNELFRK